MPSGEEEFEELDLCKKFVEDDEEGEEAIPYRTVRNIETREDGRDVYQFRVHIIEVRDLKGIQKNGMSDPVVKITVCAGEDRQQDCTKHASNCLSAIFDEQFRFDVGCNDDEFASSQIILEVFDYNMIFADSLIGRYVIDGAVIRNWENYSLPPTWLCLSAIPDRLGSQGFLRVALTVLRPGELGESCHFMEMERLAAAEFTGTLQSQVLVPLDLERIPTYLNLRVHAASGLPKTDMVGTIDPYIKVNFGGAEVSTSTFKKNQNPVWHEQLSLPVELPVLSDTVTVETYDWNRLLSDELVSTTLLSFRDIQLSEGLPPTWFHLYRPERDHVRLKDWVFGNQASFHHPSSTRWVGMVCLSGDTVPFTPTADLPEPVAVRKKLTAPEMPSFVPYVLRVNIVRLAHITGVESLRVAVYMGPHGGPLPERRVPNRSSILHLGIHGQIGDMEFEFPADLSQVPDLIISVLTEDNKRVGYYRCSAADVGQSMESRWVDLSQDPTSRARGAVRSLCLQAALYQGEWDQREPYTDIIDTTYQVRANVFQAHDLIPMPDGSINPRVEIVAATTEMATAEHRGTTCPVFNQALAFEAYLPDQIEYVAPLLVNVKHGDHIIGQAVLNAQSLPSEPTWIQLTSGKANLPAGSLLLSAELSTTVEAEWTLPPIEVRKVRLALTLAGLRDFGKPYKEVRYELAIPALNADGSVADDICVSSDWLSLDENNSCDILKPEIVDIYIPRQEEFVPQIFTRVFYRKGRKELLVGVGYISIQSKLPEVLARNRTGADLDYHGEEVEIIQPSVFTRYDHSANPNILSGELVERVTGLTDVVVEDLVETPPQNLADFPVDYDPSDPFARLKLPSEIEDFLDENPYELVEYHSYRTRNQGVFQRLLAKIGTSSEQIAQCCLKFNLVVSDVSESATIRQEHYEEIQAKLDQDFGTREKLLGRIYLTAVDQLSLREEDQFYITVGTGTRVLNPKNSVLSTKKDGLYDGWHADLNRCLELPFTHPGVSDIHISVWRKGLLSDEFIGSTLIDPEQRWLSREWRAIERKPLQKRTLWSPLSGFPCGKLDLWFELFTSEEALANPPLKFIVPEDVVTELRVVIYSTRGVVFKDDDHSDVRVSGQVYSTNFDSAVEQTDVHWRSLDGDGLFNWRFVFPGLHLPDPFMRLRLQLWDRNVLNPNGAIAEANLNLLGMSRRFIGSGGERLNVNRQWLTLLHPNFGTVPQGEIELEMTMLRQSDADQHSVGHGRDPNNQDPVLEEPQRPPTSYPPWRLDKRLKEWYFKSFRKYLMLAGVILVLLLIYWILF